ncbi:PREDICTED: topless-related protein 1 isoform X2 [Camelina sativa]|uniref:Topless-related protein 1 isoform X2 n=1 Tax=Camelina sativa TaxID=90675 RepID=A0ABM0SWX0_CAMSA|nr:PREDICTED: topless-related protein 1 isoform X2 [Camelina sativa]
MILDEKNRKNLVFLILQFFDEEGYHESLHLLEQDSGVYFDFSYFSNAILNGNWKDAEDYLSAFTSPDANTFSRKMFFHLFKWKFSEATDRGGGSESVNIFSKDLRRIPVLKDDSFDDLVEVISVDDMSFPEQTCCVDKAPGRAKLCVDLHELAKINPSLCDKLDFPKLNTSALLSLISLICPNCHGRKGGLKEDLICLILQFLYEAKYKNTLHILEQETKVFFNLNYLAEVMKLGELGKAEEYLGAFTDSADNKYSKAMFLEIQKLICLESTEWEVANPSGSLDNMSPKVKLHASVAMLAKKNPALKDKLKFPSMEKSRLLTLMKQSLAWWTSRTCNNSSSMENIPVVSYLCGTPSYFKNKFRKTGPRKKVINCKPNEINDISQCNALVLPDYCSEERIVRLTYSPSGDYILALAEDATHKLWTWSSSQNEFCKENIFPKPRLHQPQSGKTMKNEMAASVQNSTSCFAIKGSYLFSTSGGKIAVFDLKSFEKVGAFGSPTPMATYFIFIPGDLLAVGLDDGSIFIHCLSSRKVKEKLEGHDQKITCLAFSRCFNVLVSSDSDGKLCLWSTKSWVKLTSKNSTQKFCSRSNLESTSLVTHIQFDPYQIEILVVHEGWIGVHDARCLDCRVQWIPDESDTSITSATYSSDGEIIYVGFGSGFIKILDSKTLVTICRIDLTSVTQPSPSNIRLEVYPTVIAAHPSHLSQISAGLSNGKVIVLQPLWSRGWGETAPPEDDGDYPDDSDHSY